MSKRLRPFMPLRFRSEYSYILMSKFHWTPRERAIVKILDELSEAAINDRRRIVDIGCGPGLLVEAVKKNGFDYLGIDSNSHWIQYCRDRYSNASGVEFTDDGFEEDSIQYDKNDIIILNGVVHHLDDSQLDSLLKKVLMCFAVIIVDHLKRTSHLTLNSFFPFVLQRLDRGHFVRPYMYFENIKNYALEYSEEFPIRVAGVTFWTCFSNLYKPLVQSR